MKRIAIAALLAVSAFAGPQTANPKRIAAIWDAAEERMARQSDLWFKDGDFPRSVQLLRMCAALEPTDYETVTNLGFLLESIERNDEALALYIQLRQRDPDPDAAWPEANFYFKKKAYPKIPPILESTLVGHDPHANSYRTLAHAYERMNMFGDAKRVWELYVSRHPDDQTAKVNLDKVLKKLKEGFSQKT